MWTTAGLMVAAVWVGNTLDRYHHTTMALLAVLTAWVAGVDRPRSCVAIGHTGGAPMAFTHRGAATSGTDLREDSDTEGEGTSTEDPPVATLRSEPADQEVVLSPDDAMAQAARPAGLWAGRYGRPIHPIVASVAIGAWVCAFGFDLISLVADTAWVYARAAYVLTAVGVGVGAVAAMIGLADLVRVQRDTPAFQTGVRHLLAMDACLVLFAASFLVRRTSDFAWHDPVAPLAMGLSIIGLVVLAAGVWLGTRLAYTYGVRVRDGRRPASRVRNERCTVIVERAVTSLIGWNTDRVHRIDAAAPNPASVEDQPWAQALRDHHDAIRQEWDTFTSAGNQLPLIDDLLDGNQGNVGGWWRAGPFIARRRPRPPLSDHFPETVAALLAIPGLLSAMWSVLGPGAALPPHTGDNAGALNLLVGVDCPLGSVHEIGGRHVHPRRWRARAVRRHAAARRLEPV